MPALSQTERVDFLVLGAGAAGLSSVLGADDQLDLHVEDTLVAGAGLCKREAVEVTVREGPERIRWLLKLGVEFDQGDSAPDHLHLTREGGHSRRRIAHAKDTTGREIERALLAAAEARGIRIVED